MRISLKFTLAFLIVFSVVLGIYSYLRIQRESSVFEEDMKRDHETIGWDLASAVAHIWRSDGQSSALGFIDEANQSKGHVSIRWTQPGVASNHPFHPTAPELAQTALQTDRGLTWAILANQSGDLLYSYVPVVVDNQPIGILELSESLAEREKYLHVTIRRVVISTLIVFVSSGAVAACLGAWIVGRPVNRLILSANAIAEGNLEGKDDTLHFAQKDELSELADALNAMCRQLAQARDRVAEETAARIASVEQLRHADRLTAVGQLASGVAHELGTPLNVVSARAKMIRASNTADSAMENNARIIGEQAERMTRIIRQLLDFARPKKTHRIPLNLCEALQRTVELLVSTAEEKHVALTLDNNDPLYVKADPDQLQQVLFNIVVNAIQATSPGGEVRVGCCCERGQPPADFEAVEGKYVCIYVVDQGQGIPAEYIPRVFEPFFTTKGVGEGTGLGLSVSRGIIMEHQGWIQVESEVGRGSRFAVYLPEGAPDDEPGFGY